MLRQAVHQSLIYLLKCEVNLRTKLFLLSECLRISGLSHNVLYIITLIIL